MIVSIRATNEEESKVTNTVEENSQSENKSSNDAPKGNRSVPATDARPRSKRAIKECSKE